MDSVASVPDVIEVAGALRVAVGLVVRKLKQSPCAGELTLAESSALSRLERGGPATSSDLARSERISPQSMGVTVASLLDQGLIERSRDPEDGRRIVLSVTEAGRRTVRDQRGARTERRRGRAARRVRQRRAPPADGAAALLERLAEKL